MELNYKHVISKRNQLHETNFIVRNIGWWFFYEIFRRVRKKFSFCDFALNGPIRNNLVFSNYLNLNSIFPCKLFKRFLTISIIFNFSWNLENYILFSFSSTVIKLIVLFIAQINSTFLQLHDIFLLLLVVSIIFIAYIILPTLIFLFCSIYFLYPSVSFISIFFLPLFWFLI